MKLRSNRTLEKPSRVLGLLAAVVVAWAFLAPLPYLTIVADALWWQQGRQTPLVSPSLGMVVFYVVAAAITGLPLSLVFCFAIGYPAWRLASWRGLKRRKDAALVGAALGGMIDLLLALLVTATALRHHEPLSRLVLFYPGLALYIVAAGAVAGIAAWRAGGPKADGAQELTRVFA